MNDVNNVTYGKPRVGGAVFSAPLGTPLPTDATTALSDQFKALGYISDDGISNDNSPESDVIKAWGGDTILVVQTAKPDTWKFTLVEGTNINVLKEIYGAENVSGSLEDGLVVKANNTPQDPHILVLDMIMKAGVLKRIVIPQATIAEVGTISYTDGAVVGYETTVQASPDTDGITHYEYMQKKGTSR